MGVSANTVKIQDWAALIAILILRYLQLKSKFGWLLSNLVALPRPACRDAGRMNLFAYQYLWKWMDHP